MFVLFNLQSSKNNTDTNVKKTKQDVAGKNCDNIKYYNYCTVKKNGISFESRTLRIKAVDKKNKSQKFRFISITKIVVIEIKQGTRRFTIKLYCNKYDNMELIKKYFFCPDKQTWNELMRFIKEETYPIGLGFSSGSTLYLF